MLVDPPFGDTDPRIAAWVLRAAAALRDEGHVVVERARLPGTVEEFLPVYQYLFGRIPVLAPWRLTPVVRWFRDEGRRLSRGFVAERFAALSARAAEAIDGVDVVLTPTTAVTAPLVGAFRGLPPRELFEALAPLGAFTAASNLTGAPAVSVPFGAVDGVPVGVQLVGRPGDDGRLLAMARILLARAPAPT